MIAQIKAELLKIRSTRTTIGLVLGMVALILLFALLGGLLSKPPDLESVEDQRGQLGVGSLAGVFSALAGIMLVTSEYRFGTIRPTFLFNPRRSRVITAKLAAGLLAGIVFGLIGEGLGFGIGYVILSARGITYALDGGQTALLLLGTLAGIALWGALGVGLGTILRNQVGAIIGLLAWGFVVENLLFAFVPSVGRFAPVHARRRAHRDHHGSPSPGRRRRGRAAPLDCRARVRRDRPGRSPRRQLTRAHRPAARFVGPAAKSAREVVMRRVGIGVAIVAVLAGGVVVVSLLRSGGGHRHTVTVTVDGRPVQIVPGATARDGRSPRRIAAACRQPARRQRQGASRRGLPGCLHGQREACNDEPAAASPTTGSQSSRVATEGRP